MVSGENGRSHEKFESEGFSQKKEIGWQACVHAIISDVTFLQEEIASASVRIILQSTFILLVILLGAK